jgi:hypothetical protein
MPRRGDGDRVALERARRVIAEADGFLSGERKSAVATVDVVKASARAARGERREARSRAQRSVVREEGGGVRRAGAVDARGGAATGGAKTRVWSASARDEWAVDPRVDVLPAPMGAEFTAALIREKERMRKDGGTFAGRDRVGWHEIPVYGGGGLAPRPSRSDFVAYATAGGRIRTCRHVPKRGTVAYQRAQQHRAPHGSGDPQAPELPDTGYGAPDGETRAPPTWNAIEAQVARRPFLRYTDYLTNTPRDGEAIPLWAL